MNACRQWRGTAPFTPHLSTTWRWVISFMTWQLQPQKRTTVP